MLQATFRRPAGRCSGSCGSGCWMERDNDGRCYCYCGDSGRRPAAYSMLRAAPVKGATNSWTAIALVLGGVGLTLFASSAIRRRRGID